MSHLDLIFSLDFSVHCSLHWLNWLSPGWVGFVILSHTSACPFELLKLNRLHSQDMPKWYHPCSKDCFHGKPSSYWGISLYGNLHIKPLIKPFSDGCCADAPLQVHSIEKSCWNIGRRCWSGCPFPTPRRAKGGRLWRCLEESKNGLGMTSNCCRECNDYINYIWLYCIVLRTVPDVCPEPIFFSCKMTRVFNRPPRSRGRVLDANVRLSRILGFLAESGPSLHHLYFG